MTTDIPPKPKTLPGSEARERLAASGFSQLAADSARPNAQLWRNSSGKVVSLDFTDSSFEHCWLDSLEVALESQHLVPAHPWSSWWADILGKNYRPS
jgi:hypothetical protein